MIVLQNLMRLVSFNINGYAFQIESNIPFLQYLESFEADIICFQEIKQQKCRLGPEKINIPGKQPFTKSNLLIDSGWMYISVNLI